MSGCGSSGGTTSTQALSCVNAQTGNRASCGATGSETRSEYRMARQMLNSKPPPEVQKPPKPKPKPKAKPKSKPPPPPPPDPKQAALEKTVKCMQGIPLLQVKHVSLSQGGFEVFADVDEGGGNAEVVVLSSHSAAESYANSMGNSVVGNLTVATYAYRGSQNFQASVEGCLA